MARQLACSVVVLAVVISGCMDLNSTAKGKPVLVEPRQSRVEEEVLADSPAPPVLPLPQPDTASPVQPVVPQPDPSAARKYQAAYDHLNRLAKEVDDFAYDRMGRLNEGQIKAHIARWRKDIDTIRQELPQLELACEGLASMVGYADPTTPNSKLEQRLAGYNIGATSFKQNMAALAPKAAP